MAATASAATEINDNVQRSAVIDYKLRTTVAPKYKMTLIPLNNMPSGTAQIGPTSSTVLEWKLPTRVYNLSQSYISYNVHIDPTAARYTTTHEDTFDLGNAVTFGSAGGVELVNLQYAQNYVKLARKIATPMEKLLVQDNLSGLYKSNAIALGLMPGIAEQNIVPGGYNKLGTPYYTPNDSYVEPMYANTSGVSTVQEVYRQFPLSAFVGTLLAVDRDFYSPVEQYLRVTAGVGDKMAFVSSYNPASALSVGVNDPSVNAASSAQITVNNVTLHLAVEQNDEIVQGLMARYASGTLKFSIPYTTAFKGVGAAAGGQTNIQVLLSNMYGKRLKRILHSVWNPQEKFNTAYDCANWDGEKVASYQTFLDSQPLQDRALSCLRPWGGRVNSDDWLENKKFLANRSCITSKECYALNWFHIDQFYEPHDPAASLPEVNLDEGLLMDTPKQWLFAGQIPAGGISSLLYYTYAEFSREIMITNVGPQFLGSGAI